MIASGEPRQSWRGWLLDTILIFALSAFLIWPLFRMEYMENWGSIESTFIADGRMLRERGPHAAWQPNWYLGTRFDYVYPPALRHGTAALSKWLDVSTARSYHIYTAIMYCLGIAGIYWLVRAGSGWRVWAWVAAISVSIQSPVLLFVEIIRKDYAAVRYMPTRLGVLIRYGEGPHMSALAILGFALAAAWWGLRKGQRLALVISAFLCAVVVANNFYGATALAIFFPILVWAIAITDRDPWVLARAVGIAALAYGLSAFWLTPSYLRVTLTNMKLVSQPGHTWSILLEIGLMAAFGWVSWILAKGRPERAWQVFAAGSLSRIALYVLGNSYFDFRTIGEPHRFGPEFDQFFIMGIVTVIAWLWRRGWSPRLAVVGLIVLSLIPVKGWLRRPWSVFESAQGYQHRVEYELTKWVHDNMPASRVFVAGSVRFWFNAWFDLAEVGGGSDQGTLNPMSTWAYYQVIGADTLEARIAWLQATGADAVVVNYPESREYYHDYRAATKFETMPVLYDNQRGDRIFRVPRKFPGLARIVKAEFHKKLDPPKIDYDYDALSRYVQSIEENSPRAAEWNRLGPEAIHVKAVLEPGEAIVVQETWDEGWRAVAEGREVPVHQDALHFMFLEPGPGVHDVTLIYSLPRENQAGRVITGLSLLVGVGLIWRARRR
jgi:hypothetical protein